jgi:hypothetical protein
LQTTFKNERFSDVENISFLLKHPWRRMREVRAIKLVTAVLTFILGADSYNIYNLPRSSISKLIGKRTPQYERSRFYLQSNSNPTIAKDLIYRKESVTIGPMMTFFRIQQTSFMRAKIRLFSSLHQISMKNIIAEIQREIAVLLYAPIEQKLVVLFYQTSALFSIYLLSLFIPILSAAVIRVSLAAVALVNGVNVSVEDMRNKRIERTRAIKKIRDEEAANIALEKKQAEERFVTSELAKRLLVVNALKEEEERLATRGVKIKNEEQARVAILESAKREEVTRVLVEQANMRQLEQQRVNTVTKLKLEEETELRILAVQGKKDEKIRVTEINKFEQQEASRLVKDKKDNELKIVKDNKTSDRLKREEDMIQSVLLKTSEEAARVRAKRDEEEAVAAEKAALLAAQILAREQQENRELILKNMKIAEALAFEIEEKKIEVAEKAQKIEDNRLAFESYKQKKDEDDRLFRQNQIIEEEKVLKIKEMSELADRTKKETDMPWLNRLKIFYV